jgi:hypothetical protein
MKVACYHLLVTFQTMMIAAFQTLKKAAFPLVAYQPWKMAAYLCLVVQVSGLEASGQGYPVVEVPKCHPM